MKEKRPTIWAYLDGERHIEVVQAALDNNISLHEMKNVLIAQNLGHDLEFRPEN